MSLVLFGHNSLEAAATVTVSPAALSTKPITRIYDRDRGPQYEGGSAAQTDIDIDLGATPPAVSAWALINHNVSGVTATLYADTTSPPTTSRDTFAATGADFLRTIGALTLRYWRIRIPAMTPAPKIGELLLGVPRTITQNPFIDTSAKVTRVNVHSDESPAGYRWAVRNGSKKTVLPFGWNVLGAADVASIEALIDEISDGAKNFLVQDVLGVLRWMAWTDPEFNPVPLGLDQFSVQAFTLVEAL